MKHFVFRLAVLTTVAAMMTVMAMAQEESTRSKPSTTGSDSDFMKMALNANYAEVQLGRLAQSKAQDADVKDFANMMVRDHQKAIDQIQQAMKNMSTTASNQAAKPQMDKDDQQLYDRLSKLSGAAFDRAYIDAMVQDHQKDIREFEREAGITGTSSDTDTDRQKPESVKPSESETTGDSDSDAKSLAKELLPTLRQHLQKAEALQRQLRK